MRPYGPKAQPRTQHKVSSQQILVPNSYTFSFLPYPTGHQVLQSLPVKFWIFPFFLHFQYDSKLHVLIFQPFFNSLRTVLTTVIECILVHTPCCQICIPKTLIIFFLLRIPGMHRLGTQINVVKISAHGCVSSHTCFLII